MDSNEVSSLELDLKTESKLDTEFDGLYKHSLDAKGRLRLPFRYKPELGEECRIVRGSNRSLMIMSKEEYFRLRETYRCEDIRNMAGMKLARSFFSNVKKITEDNQGRFLLDTELRSHANIDKDVVFVGVGSWVELWSAEEWAKYNDDIADADDFDKMLEASYKLENERV